MLIPAHCHNYLKKSSLFLPGAASEHLPRTLYTLSAQDLPPFPARQASGIPFRAGNDTFFCPELPRSTLRAGFGAFSCPAGGCAIGKIPLFNKKTSSANAKDVKVWADL